MNIGELTIRDVREIAQIFDFGLARQSTLNAAAPWLVGQTYHIRTVTHYWTGRLASVSEQELVIEDACWIADTGRFSDFFSDGPNEAEPVDGPVIIGRGAIVDAQEWKIVLPRLQK